MTGGGERSRGVIPAVRSPTPASTSGSTPHEMAPRVMAEPNRRRVVEVLREGSMTVGAIAERVPAGLQAREGPCRHGGRRSRSGRQSSYLPAPSGAVPRDRCLTTFLRAHHASAFRQLGRAAAGGPEPGSRTASKRLRGDFRMPHDRIEWPREWRTKRSSCWNACSTPRGNGCSRCSRIPSA